MFFGVGEGNEISNAMYELMDQLRCCVARFLAGVGSKAKKTRLAVV